MPFIFKLLGYGGNGLLFFLGLIVLFTQENFWPGLFMAGLGGLNLYLIRKIDLYSREEAWLETELRKRELSRQIAEYDREDSAGGTPGEPARIRGADDIRTPR
jgi:hypothetical protein